MMRSGLVFGLLDTSAAIGDRVAAARYRNLTVAWSRYGYHGVILERDSVDAILEAAATGGYRYCFIQPYGWILAERWKLADQRHADVFTAMAAWIAGNEFFIAGDIVHSPTGWYGFQPGCLLVDLPAYERAGAPRFHSESSSPQQLPCPHVDWDDDRIVALKPTPETEIQRPTQWGWNAVRAGLEAQLPILALSDEIRAQTLNLEATTPSRRAALQPYFGSGIAQYGREQNNPGLSADQCAFLNVIQTQTAHARNGVFLWNIESYADIETPREDFQAPVTSLYSVAAGFKPNRMLETHGFAAETRVVFFDYSARALEVKAFMVEQWDGTDFPRFVRHIFQRFPHPDTFYQLWDDATPENVDWKDIEFAWHRELTRWGGADAIRDHWQAYAQLQHEYVCCNLLTDPDPLLKRIAHEPNAMIWWSNAFFTMYGNWFHTLEERRHAYDRWVTRLAEANPQLYLFGSDVNNTNVNSIQAAEYLEPYLRSGGDCLSPCRLYRTELRM